MHPDPTPAPGRALPHPSSPPAACFGHSTSKITIPGGFLRTHIRIHLGVLPPFALPQAFGFPSFQQLTPEAFLWVKPENGELCLTQGSQGWWQAPLPGCCSGASF